MLIAIGWRRWLHGVSLNKLMEELSVRALTEHDTEMRFRMRAARGLKLLDELDHRHVQSTDP